MLLRLSFMVLFLAAGQFISAQGIKFIQDDLAQAKERATADNKLIFIDAYTSWCGPCKRLSKNVFPQEAAGTFFNKEFVNLKMNMEKGEGPSFAKKYKITAYPTLLVIDADGKEVHRVVGAPKLDGLLEFGRAASGRQDKSAEWAILYDNGDRSYETIYNYVSTLNDADKSSGKITNEYLKTQSDLSSDDNLKFIYAATYESDSKVFDLLIENKKKIVALVGASEVDEQVKNALDRTAAKAATYEMISLIDDAHDIGKKHAPQHIETSYPSWINQYFTKVPDPKSYMERIDQNWPAEAVLDAGKIACKTYYNQSDLQNKVISVLEDKEKQLRDNDQYYSTLSVLYRLTEQDKKSIKILEKGIKHLKSADISVKALQIRLDKYNG